MSKSDEPLKESLRSETAFYNTETKDPIRIHKYNIDSSEEDDDDSSTSSSSSVESSPIDSESSSDESIEKRDNIKDNLMDLKRISLYSEKSKRSSDLTLDDGKLENKNNSIYLIFISCFTNIDFYE
jgi:hypothetical protein